MVARVRVELGATVTSDGIQRLLTSMKSYPASRFALALFGCVFAGNAGLCDAPLSELRPALPQIPAHEFTLADYGAVGDGHTLNTAAFNRASTRSTRPAAAHSPCRAVSSSPVPSNFA